MPLAPVVPPGLNSDGIWFSATGILSLGVSLRSACATRRTRTFDLPLIRGRLLPLSYRRMARQIIAAQREIQGVMRWPKTRLEQIKRTAVPVDSDATPLTEFSRRGGL